MGSHSLGFYQFEGRSQIEKGTRIKKGFAGARNIFV